MFRNLETIRSITLDNGDTLFSFGIVSLFKNVLKDEALHIARKRLENDLTLRINLMTDTIIELLTICIKTRYSQLGS